MTHPALNAYIAQSLVDDRLQEAESRRRTRTEWTQVGADPFDSVTVRRSRPGDGEALERLADRDGRRIPSGPLVVAEVGGELLAARSLETGTVVADPFRPTAHLVEMLELRSAHLRDGRPAAPTRRSRALLRAFPPFARAH